MTLPDDLSVPEDWRELSVKKLEGYLLVIGGANSGKTTLAQWLKKRLQEADREVAFLDGDPGQCSLGVPSTITLSDPDELRNWFVGSNTPRGNMLSLVTGIRRLASTITEHRTVVHDTSGFVDPSPGGVQLKRSIVDLLQPDVILAPSRTEELEPILNPLRRKPGTKIVELSVSDSVNSRDRDQRVRHRRERYRHYFSDAGSLSLNWESRAVWPKLTFETDRLVGLCNRDGFAEGIGLIEDYDHESNELTLKTPVGTPELIRELCLGDLKIDPETFTDVEDLLD